MKLNFLFGIAALSLAITSCDIDAEPLDKDKSNNGAVAGHDSHSFSNTDEIRTKHLDLEIDVDFEKKTIYGVARHKMERLKDTDTAIFDINGPEIQKVTLGKKGQEVETDFIIGKEQEFLGQPLSIKIDKKTEYINIYYKTTENAAALDWMDPELTEGKKHPYLYTQGQAILTRSWIPVQGTPANRITYSADVKVPAELMAVMSASNPREKNPEGKYHFEMKQPIPVYLIALAVGNLEYKSLGENCGIYTEPEMLKKAVWEFADLPKMIHAAENLYGPYQWEQYDVIVLPYSFPFGGMENPRLTFANPTLIAGDRSSVSVIAHELAHSWSGNLVTNASWNDFWLNEGFTVYFENRIMEELYGKEVADMLALIEFQELQTELEELSEEDTHLKLELKKRNPDDGMTSVAYVKGAFFLKTLERDFGRQRFDTFLKKYFKDHAFQTLTTEQFKKYLNDNLISQTDIQFNVDEWLYKPGLPKNCYAVSSPRFEKIQKLARDFASGKDIFKKPAKKKGKKQVPALKRDQYVPQEWQAFIRALPKKMDPERLAVIDKKLGFSTWGNAEVATEWYVLGINSNYTEIRPQIEKFISKVGRRKFLLPIYTALHKNAASEKWGMEIYKKYRENYHPVSIMTLDDLLDYQP
ncbi:M1 family metallopeptidase [Fluviicola sp.]|uniref:M1 family metallopeptidase n=1 Tax=Fluviicola sp. TaxID=1917219 RepID=UPI0026020F1F|nr:M1 family metallopeptidase [Fluviicola sp.]